VSVHFRCDHAHGIASIQERPLAWTADEDGGLRHRGGQHASIGVYYRLTWASSATSLALDHYQRTGRRVSSLIVATLKEIIAARYGWLVHSPLGAYRAVGEVANAFYPEH
jgi:hypothetical protein